MYMEKKFYTVVFTHITNDDSHQEWVYKHCVSICRKFELLADKLHRLPQERDNIKSVGACPHVMNPSFHYFYNDGNIWRIDDINRLYVQNWFHSHWVLESNHFLVRVLFFQMVAFMLMMCHVDDYKESMMMNDSNFVLQKSQKNGWSERGMIQKWMQIKVGKRSDIFIFLLK